MSKKAMIIILACALPLRELHRLFSTDIRPGLYFLDKTILESPAWYVSDIVNKLTIAIILLFWYLRERGKHRVFAKFLGVFTVFYTLDLVIYLLNHSHAGTWYLCVYIPVLVYGITITTRRSEKTT